jgi:hypothetical protein
LLIHLFSVFVYQALNMWQAESYYINPEKTATAAKGYAHPQKRCGLKPDYAAASQPNKHYFVLWSILQLERIV